MIHSLESWLRSGTEICWSTPVRWRKSRLPCYTPVDLSLCRNHGLCPAGTCLQCAMSTKGPLIELEIPRLTGLLWNWILSRRHSRQISLVYETLFVLYNSQMAFSCMWNNCMRIGQIWVHPLFWMQLCLGQSYRVENACYGLAPDFMHKWSHKTSPSPRSLGPNFNRTQTISICSCRRSWYCKCVMLHSRIRRKLSARKHSAPNSIPVETHLLSIIHFWDHPSPIEQVDSGDRLGFQREVQVAENGRFSFILSDSNASECVER